MADRITVDRVGRSRQGTQALERQQQAIRVPVAPVVAQPWWSEWGADPGDSAESDAVERRPGGMPERVPEEMISAEMI
jgi:hypothetical protein